MQGTWLKRVGGYLNTAKYRENKDEYATSNQGKQSRVTLRFTGLKFAHLCIQLFCIKPFVLHTIQSFFVEKMWKRKTGCNADMKSFVLTCMMSTTRIYCRERKQSSVVTRNDCRSSKSYLQTSHFLLRSNSSFIMFLLPFPSDLLNFLSHHRVIHIISLNWCLCALEPLV